MFDSVVIKDSFRRAYICTESPYSTRYTFMSACRLKESSSRYCSLYTIANNAERTCYFKVDGKIVIHSVLLNLPYTYYDEKDVWVHKDPISQRQTMFTLGIASEKKSYIERVHRSNVDTTQTTFSLSYFSEKQIILQLHQNYDIRTIQFSYTTESERISLISRAYSITLHSPLVKIAVGSNSSDRYVSVKAEVTHSERKTLYITTPYSERYIYTKLRLFSDRYVSILIYATTYLHSTLMVQARPEPSERLCIFKALLNYSERSTFVETRTVFISKKPFIMNDSNIVISSYDSVANITINSDRAFNIDGSEITSIESVHKIDAGKIILSVANQSYNLTMVDFMGARMAIDIEEKERKLLSSSEISLNITIT